MRSTLYAVASFETPLSKRASRAAQSAAADSLLQSLSASLSAPLTSSKTHSRAVAAAAVAPKRAGARLGIDVEYVDERRPMSKILALLTGENTLSYETDTRALYRLWTFAEAYFKAFGAYPDADKMRLVSKAEGESPCALSETIFVLHKTIFEDFVLCIVWCGLEPPLPI